MNVSPFVVAVPVAVVFAALGAAKSSPCPRCGSGPPTWVLRRGLPGHRNPGDRRGSGVLVGAAAPVIGGIAGAGLLLLLAGALVAHLRNGDSPSYLVPAVVAGLLVAAYLVVLPGATP